MRVAYDHQIFGWQRYGGISRYFFELARHIDVHEGVDLRIISPLFVNEYLLASGLPVAGIHVPQIRRTGRLYRKLNRWMAPVAMRHFNPDLVHETYYSQGTVAPPRAKVVITVHDMIHELFPADFSKWDTTSKEKASAVKRADHVICVSENTRKDLVGILDVDPAKTSVVHHGYELSQAPAEIRRCNEPYILYVGSRGGYKNFDSLLQAYAASSLLNKNFRLVAFGGGSLTAREQARVDALGGGKWDVLHFSGGDDVLADLYSFAEVFVYPSCYEGFGIPPLEAMSCGCPVLSSDRSSLPEVVGDAAGFFDPESVDSLIDALNQVVSDSSFRQTLINKGRLRCAKFSWKKCADETLEVYKRVIAS